jgi:hypothetical protein
MVKCFLFVVALLCDFMSRDTFHFSIRLMILLFSNAVLQILFCFDFCPRKTFDKHCTSHENEMLHIETLYHTKMLKVYKNLFTIYAHDASTMKFGDDLPVFIITLQYALLYSSKVNRGK